MSDVNHAEFGPAMGIQELSFNEIDEVDGGLVHLVIVAGVVVGIYLISQISAELSHAFGH